MRSAGMVSSRIPVQMDTDDQKPPDSWFGWLPWGCSGLALFLLVAVLLLLVLGVLLAFAAIGGNDVR